MEKALALACNLFLLLENVDNILRPLFKCLIQVMQYLFLVVFRIPKPLICLYLSVS